MSELQDQIQQAKTELEDAVMSALVQFSVKTGLEVERLYVLGDSLANGCGERQAVIYHGVETILQ